MEVQIQSTNGLIVASVVGEVQIEGKPYVIIKNGVGGYINGIVVPYLVVPPHLIIRDVNSVRIYDEKEETNIARI